jgi:hypothetical protein
VITTRRLMRAARAAMPAWLLAVFGVCLIIPGPFDEMGMLVVLAVLVAVQPVRARRAASAWRGGKSHRAQG